MMNKKMLSIIGGFADGVYKLTQKEIECRHHSRMIGLCRQMFIDVCEKKHVIRLSIPDFGSGFSYATLGEWMGSGYMGIHKEQEEHETILFMLSDDKIKEIFLWLKTQI